MKCNPDTDLGGNNMKEISREKENRYAQPR
jgi:hypothetical protein